MFALHLKSHKFFKLEKIYNCIDCHDDNRLCRYGNEFKHDFWPIRYANELKFINSKFHSRQ